MFLILSFVLLFFQNINAAKNKQDVPTVAQVEEAVADFGRQIKQILRPIKSDDEMSEEIAKFRKKLVTMYMPAWLDKIDRVTVRQRMGTIDLPIFDKDINVLVQEFKKNQQIPNLWNYQFLIDEYERKLRSLSIHYDPENLWQEDILSYLVTRLVNQQLAMPDTKGQKVLLKELLRQIYATHLFSDLSQEKNEELVENVKMKFANKLNQKFNTW